MTDETQQEAEQDARAREYERVLARLMLIANRELDDRSLSPGDAQALLAALAVAVRERDQAAAANERLVETNRALSRSAIGNRDGRWKAERERDQARDALRKIAANPLLTLNRDIARAALKAETGRDRGRA